MKHKAVLIALVFGCGGAPQTTRTTPDEEPVAVETEPATETRRQEPIDGVRHLELHALRAQNEPDRWHAIQWDAEAHRYLASRFDDPERKVEIGDDEVQSLLNLFEEHRDTFTLPVETSDFLIVRASFIAMDRDRVDGEPSPAPQEEIDRLNHFSDQWGLLGDIARGMERDNRRLETFRGVRQSMENEDSVCAEPESERCRNHRAWTAAFEAVATRFREIVDSAVD